MTRTRVGRLAAAVATVGAALAAMVVSAPAGAITDGTLDGDAHPYVGLMVAQDASGTPLWRCSGTLLSPTVLLTAGHCTEAPAAHAEIWFAADVDAGRPGNGYPFTGEAGGTTYTHPDYDPDAFVVRDVGVVVLDAPHPAPGGVYGRLPAQDQLDALRPRRSTTFTPVGYGLQRSLPDAAAFLNQGARVRMSASSHLLQVNTGFTGDFSLLLSNNASTGGTCFGDSGGPDFLGTSNVVAGVTSFGLNATCGGTGGVFRMDRAWARDWVRTFLD